MARYADSMLADGEVIAVRRRQHILATFIDGRVPWALFAAFVILFLLSIQLDQGTLRDLVGYVVLALFIVSVGWLVKVYWAWYAQDYIVTNRRVLKVEGILNKRLADSSLEKVNDAVLEQNLFGRLLGYGDLDILTAADVAVDRYRMLADAPSFKKAMLDQKHLLELEPTRLPAPPLGASAPRTMSSDEITRALDDLAGLRARGAITAEEYEAKKRDLLARL